MALFFTFLSLLLSGVSAAPTAEEGGFTVSAVRKQTNAQSRALLPGKFQKRLATANFSTALDTDLYWYGNFTVGNGTNLELLIDTGSSDLLVNNGTYQASNYQTTFQGNQSFSITYEGVDRQGFGFETINGSVVNEMVSAGGLTVLNQTMGNTSTFAYYDVPPLPYANPGDGIVGFCFQGDSVFMPQPLPWFYNLCAQKIIDVCRFGLAFGTTGIGQLVVGKYAKKVIDGPVVTLPNIGGNLSYAVMGDVTLDNKIVLSNQTIIMDVGTDNIQSPIPQAQQLFKLLNYPTVTLTEAPTPFDPGTTIEVINGFFNCSSPPDLGFSFPAQSQLKQGQNATIFSVSKDVWGVFNNTATNCTSILGGTNGIYVGNTSAWLLGQSFFAGHYIDFHTMGSPVMASGDDTYISFANLKNPADGSY